MHPNRTVTSGQITLQNPATKVQVGIPSPAVLETTELDPQRVGVTKRISRLILRLWNSMGGRVGQSDSNTYEMRYRSPSTPMGTAPPPYTGDVEIEWDGDYGRKQSAVIVKDKPAPVNLAGLFPPQGG